MSLLKAQKYFSIGLWLFNGFLVESRFWCLRVSSLIGPKIQSVRFCRRNDWDTTILANDCDVVRSCFSTSFLWKIRRTFNALNMSGQCPLKYFFPNFLRINNFVVMLSPWESYVSRYFSSIRFHLIGREQKRHSPYACFTERVPEKQKVCLPFQPR